MARRNHSESEIGEGGRGVALNGGFLFSSSILPPQSHVIQGLYKPGVHMFHELRRLSARMNLSWLNWGNQAETRGRRGDGEEISAARPERVVPPRHRSIAISKEKRRKNLLNGSLKHENLADRNSEGREITSLCSACDYWDKTGTMGCIIKRVNGEEFTCPYTSGHLNLSIRQPRLNKTQNHGILAQCGAQRPLQKRLTQSLLGVPSC